MEAFLRSLIAYQGSNVYRRRWKQVTESWTVIVEAAIYFQAAALYICCCELLIQLSLEKPK